jgi:hypothetical protein
MAFDVLSNQTLIERFEPYFKHPNPDRHVLQMGDRALACKNARAALSKLGFLRVSGDNPELYDEQLSEAVKRFQQEKGHRSTDGRIGPGTRSRLVSEVLQVSGVSGFAELDASEFVRVPTVFLSYAWADAPRVDKLDQWLRDHGTRVIRDLWDFAPGSQIPDNIWKSILSADKVIAVYSEKSKNRDWPSFELQIAEQVERSIGAQLLIYLRLDKTSLKAHDPHRIAIEAQGKTLKQIGLDIQKALGKVVKRPRCKYDENAPL